MSFMDAIHVIYMYASSQYVTSLKHKRKKHHKKRMKQTFIKMIIKCMQHHSSNIAETSKKKNVISTAQNADRAMKELRNYEVPGMNFFFSVSFAL